MIELWDESPPEAPAGEPADCAPLQPSRPSTALGTGPVLSPPKEPNAFHRLGLEGAQLSAPQAAIVYAYLCHNLNNAMALLQVEAQLAGLEARPPRGKVIEEILARVAWTIDQVRLLGR